MTNQQLRCIFITGMAGSGKSTAIRILEDCGFSYIDNLPVDFLAAAIKLYLAGGRHSLVISLNLTSAEEVQRTLELALNGVAGCEILPIFMTADKPTLIRRFAETRRRHPLSRHRHDLSLTALKDAIDAETSLLEPLINNFHIINTSSMLRAQLQQYLIDLLHINWSNNLILTFQSFAFKRGVPIDCDFVFDARALPNPYYDPALRPLTGKDAPVAEFLANSATARQFEQDICSFLANWLPQFNTKQHSYISVAIGCTGGQHRSVYIVERLAKHFAGQYQTLIRHREQDQRRPS